MAVYFINEVEKQTRMNNPDIFLKFNRCIVHSKDVLISWIYWKKSTFKYSHTICNEIIKTRMCCLTLSEAMTWVRWRELLITLQRYMYWSLNRRLKITVSRLKWRHLACVWPEHTSHTSYQLSTHTYPLLLGSRKTIVGCLWLNMAGSWLRWRHLMGCLQDNIYSIDQNGKYHLCNHTMLNGTINLQKYEPSINGFAN